MAHTQAVSVCEHGSLCMKIWLSLCCVAKYFCVWRELRYCARATTVLMHFCSSSDSSMCVCMSVCLPSASDGKRWLHSNARVVRKPAGSLVLATAGGGTIITVITASVSDWEICQSGLKAVFSVLLCFVLIGHNGPGHEGALGERLYFLPPLSKKFREKCKSFSPIIPYV